ncbi:MAG TPA: PrsW family glutamic-type intramembrane protease [Candidatus Dormibacteraeota bacterium]|nr:PrsW family glutamic-type intramembrane protease [Candidatus Dormibacteraeota bacterium]
MLWLASLVITAVTGDTNLVPTVILLGSFLVPVTAVIWYLDHYQSETLTPSMVVRAFVLGGLLGVLAASVLEAWLLAEGALVSLGIGLVEEGAKALALVWIARSLPHYRVRDGVVLGAAVGFGFAAFESSGYAFNALIIQQNGVLLGLSLPNMVYTELVRGVLAPTGHGLWTGILGGVLFSSARGSRLRLSLRVIVTYLVVSILHALWDSMQSIALLVTDLITGSPALHIAAVYGVLPPPTPRQVDVYLACQWGGLLVLSLIGFSMLVLVWRWLSVRQALGRA